MKGTYHIDLRPDATPFALTVPRRVAIPLMEKVKTELQLGLRLLCRHNLENNGSPIS